MKQNVFVSQYCEIFLKVWFQERSLGKAVVKSDFSLFSLKSGFVKSLFLMFFGPGSLLEALIMKLRKN